MQLFYFSVCVCVCLHAHLSVCMYACVPYVHVSTGLWVSQCRFWEPSSGLLQQHQVLATEPSLQLFFQWILCVCLYMYMCMVTHEPQQETALSIHPVGSKDVIYVIKLGSKYLYPLSHLAGHWYNSFKCLWLFIHYEKSLLPLPSVDLEHEWTSSLNVPSVHWHCRFGAEKVQRRRWRLSLQSWWQ